MFIILLIISGIAPYQQAFEYEKLGEYEKAITFYKKAHPVLLDNNLYRGGKCLMNLERFECAVHYFNRLVNESKDSPYYNHAIENLAICYEKLHDYENAITIWKRKIDARSLYRIAKNYEKLGINQDTMYIRIAKEFPKSEFALLSLKKVPADSGNIRRKVQYSHHLYEDIIKTMSQDEFTARSLFKLGRFKDAKVRFKKLGFKYMTALCDEKLGNPGQAINGYKKAGTPKALLIAGMLCEKINKKKQAIVLYQSIPPSSRYYACANMRTGLIAFEEIIISEQDNKNLALKSFDKVGTIVSLYWKGKTFLRCGDKEKGLECYWQLLKKAPFSWYAYLLNSIGDFNLPDSCSTGLQPVKHKEIIAYGDESFQPVKTGKMPIPPSNMIHLDKIRLLLDYGIQNQAIDVMKKFDFSVEDKVTLLFTLSTLCHQNEIINYGVYYAQKIKKILGEVPKDILHLLYPMGFLPLIQDCGLVLALIRQESLFNPSVISSAGAIGLAQIMPSTGKEIARKLGIQDYDLFDPETNIKFGIYYLNYCLDDFKKPEYALAAYNGGPTRVKRWLENEYHHNIDIFVERISITQTRDYVKKVMGNYFAYKRIYAR